jgi:hypothetical protein
VPTETVFDRDASAVCGVRLRAPLLTVRFPCCEAIYRETTIAIAVSGTTSVETVRYIRGLHANSLSDGTGKIAAGTGNADGVNWDRDAGIRRLRALG